MIIIYCYTSLYENDVATSICSSLANYKGINPGVDPAPLLGNNAIRG